MCSDVLLPKAKTFFLLRITTLLRHQGYLYSAVFEWWWRAELSQCTSYPWGRSPVWEFIWGPLPLVFPEVGNGSDLKLETRTSKRQQFKLEATSFYWVLCGILTAKKTHNRRLYRWSRLVVSSLAKDYRPFVSIENRFKLNWRWWWWRWCWWGGGGGWWWWCQVRGHLIRDPAVLSS